MKFSRKFFRAVCCAGFCMVAGSASPAWSNSYDDLRRTHDAMPISSVVQLRANAEALAGKVVELQGEVSGVMTREKSRVVLLKVGNDMSVLSAPASFTDTSLLRAGVLVGVLARVEKTNPSGVLTILAVREGDVPLPAASGVDSGEILSPMVTTIDTLPEAPASPMLTVAAPIATTPIAAAVRPVARVAKPASSAPSSVDMDELVQSQIPAYAAIVRRHNSKLKPQVVAEISEALLRAGHKHNMDPRFLAAIIAVESNFDPHTVSRSGAMGLGQIMPFNLKAAGIQNPWNPTQNIMGAAKLLRGLLDSYQGRPNATLLAVAGYNAGSGAVRRAGYKVPKGAQVQRYVWKVYYRYKAFAPDMF